MISDLKLSKIKSKNLKINDVFVKEEYVSDFITDLEIESNFSRPYVVGSFTVDEDLFKLSIGNVPSNSNDTLTLYLEDKNSCKYCKKFKITTSYKKKLSSSKNSWEIGLIDIYGDVLTKTEYAQKISEKTYKGTPLEIIEDALSDLLGDIEYKECPIITKRNEVKFIDDNCMIIQHRFVRDLTPLENLTNFCKSYNIIMYQNDCMNVIQNPTFENTSETDIKYIENCPSISYAYKICDKIKQPFSVPSYDKKNYRILFNAVGKKHNTKELNFNDLCRLLCINNNSDEYKNYIDVGTSDLPSQDITLSSLVYSEFYKHLKSNSLAIYVRSDFKKTLVGTVVNTDVASDDKFSTERIKGDERFSGKWIIYSSTIKIVQDTYLYRLILCRFDNQIALDKKKDLITTSNSDSVSNSEKSIKDLKDLKDKREKILQKERK